MSADVGSCVSVVAVTASFCNQCRNPGLGGCGSAPRFRGAGPHGTPPSGGAGLGSSPPEFQQPSSSSYFGTSGDEPRKQRLLETDQQQEGTPEALLCLEDVSQAADMEEHVHE